jgi:hypothetical protein
MRRLTMPKAPPRDHQQFLTVRKQLSLPGVPLPAPQAVVAPDS